MLSIRRGWSNRRKVYKSPHKCSSIVLWESATNGSVLDIRQAMNRLGAYWSRRVGNEHNPKYIHAHNKYSQIR